MISRAMAIKLPSSALTAASSVTLVGLLLVLEAKPESRIDVSVRRTMSAIVESDTSVRGN